MQAFIGAAVWTVAFALPFRRFRWSRTPLRAALIGSLLVLLLADRSDEMGFYEVRRWFYLEDVTVTPAAVGALVAFLFYEWRDRTGRDVFKPLSARSIRWLRGAGIAAALVVAALVGLALWLERKQAAERLDSLPPGVIPDDGGFGAPEPLEFDLRYEDGGLVPREEWGPPTKAEIEAAKKNRR